MNKIVNINYHFKVVNLDDVRKSQTLFKIRSILNELVYDGGEVEINDIQLYCILRYFYAYYVRKHIQYAFEETMINHFNDLCDDAYEEEAVVDLDFVLNELKLYELLDSRIEVNPIDTKKIVKRIRNIYK